MVSVLGWMHVDMQATSILNGYTVMGEPQYLEGDDVALKDECESCGNFIFTCECEAEDPDRMHDEMYED